MKALERSNISLKIKLPESFLQIPFCDLIDLSQWDAEKSIELF